MSNPNAPINYAEYPTEALLLASQKMPTPGMVAELQRRYIANPTAYFKALDLIRPTSSTTSVARPPSPPKPTPRAIEAAWHAEADRLWAKGDGRKVVMRGSTYTSRGDLYEAIRRNAIADAKVNTFNGTATASDEAALAAANARRNYVGVQARPARAADGAPTEATEYALAAPNPATGASGVASADFTVSIPTGTTLSSPAVITPDDGEDGGTFTPETVQLNGPNATGTFTYTPAVAGEHEISTTSDSEALTDPDPVTFTATVAADQRSAGRKAGR